MKKTALSIIAVMLAVTAVAQLPEKAEDISPLLYGESIPGATLKAADGNEHSLQSLMEEKPTVLLFYRGGWCPYCNRHLAEIRDVEEEVTNLGFHIIGISPDSPENIRQTGNDKNLKYRLFSDGDGTLIKKTGLAFQAPAKYGDMLKENSGGGNKEGFLPVPAVFVVNQKGVIQFEYINPDYSTRLSGGLLLAVLKELRGELK